MAIENGESQFLQRELRGSMKEIGELLKEINDKALGKKGQYLPIESAEVPHIRGELSWKGIKAQGEARQLGPFTLQINPFNITVAPFTNGNMRIHYRVVANYRNCKEEGEKNTLELGTASNLTELKSLLEGQIDNIKQSTQR